MDVVMLIGVGLLTGVTTVLFGFGGGFVTVPVVVWADAALGADAMRVATATSALVMVVSAGFATAVTPRRVLVALRGSAKLFILLAAGASAGALSTRLAPADLARWAFVAYLALTIADLLLRRGFLRPSTRVEATTDAPRPLPACLGAPVGAVAAFLGVGGSVMTVPAMRRAGHTMQVATALANPLTLAIALPATAVSLGGAAVPAAHAHVNLVGLIDLRAASALLLGALPVIAVLRRRPPRIPDRTYAWAYLGLLAMVTVAMLLSAQRGTAATPTREALIRDDASSVMATIGVRPSGPDGSYLITRSGNGRTRELPSAATTVTTHITGHSPDHTTQRGPVRRTHRGNPDAADSTDAVQWTCNISDPAHAWTGDN
jgi:uncharacterized membrane protein YfcA